MNRINRLYHSLKYRAQQINISSRYPGVSFVKSPLSCLSRLRKESLSFSYSQFSQDTIDDDSLNLRQKGVFVDIGLNHPLFNSNTVYFEFARSWSGLCINPLSNLADLYTSLRPNTSFINCAVSDSAGYLPFTIVTGSQGWEDQLSSVSPRLRGYHDKRVEVPCRRSDSILASLRYDWNSIDLMSPDVEGHEMSVISSLGI